MASTSPKVATEAQLLYIEKQEELWHWNHKFWLHMNAKFASQLQSFKDTVLRCNEASLRENSSSSGGLKEDAAFDPELLAQFYRQYLEENKANFQQYHSFWWRKNFALLYYAFMAHLSRMFK